jgi:hypothetical protein
MKTIVYEIDELAADLVYLFADFITDVSLTLCSYFAF